MARVFVSLRGNWTADFGFFEGNTSSTWGGIPSLKRDHGTSLATMIEEFHTPPKTNIEPENWWFVDVSPFPTAYFQVPC